MMDSAILTARHEMQRLQAFWSDANRSMQERHLLNDTVDDCSYTIRSCPAASGHFASISVKVRGTILHFKICVELSETGTPLYRIPSNRPIASPDLIDLIERHYRVNPLEGNGTHLGELVTVRGCYLRTPVPKPQQSRSVDPRSRDPYVDAPDPPVRRCPCGLPLSLTSLPDGWSVHRSSERGSQGMLYFKNPDGRSSWLPDPKIDRKCSTWDYLDHGNLNTKVYQKYHSRISYEPNSELSKRLQS